MPQLQEIFEAIVLSRVLYAVQSRGDYASSVDIENLQKLVNIYYSLTNMLTNCDKTLFKAVKCGRHCLNHLFTVKTKNVYIMSLLPRRHRFILPQLKLQSARNSFVNFHIFS